MPKHRITLTLVLTLAACTAGDVGEVTSASPTVPAEATSAPNPAPPRLLGYTMTPGEETTYDVTVTQTIAFEASGDAPGLGEETLPIDADLVTESTGETVHAYSIGSRPDTVDVTITARFPDTRATGTVNGRTVDSLEGGGIESELARIDPVDVVLTVGPRGRVLARSEGDERILGAGLAALTGISNDLFGRPIGFHYPRSAN
jgi:hypothetical protein